jgi:hypothetical protein
MNFYPHHHQSSKKKTLSDTKTESGKKKKKEISKLNNLFKVCKRLQTGLQHLNSSKSMSNTRKLAYWLAGDVCPLDRVLAISPMFKKI